METTNLRKKSDGDTDVERALCAPAPHVDFYYFISRVNILMVLLVMICFGTSSLAIVLLRSAPEEVLKKYASQYFALVLINFALLFSCMALILFRNSWYINIIWIGFVLVFVGILIGGLIFSGLAFLIPQ